VKSEITEFTEPILQESKSNPNFISIDELRDALNGLQNNAEPSYQNDEDQKFESSQSSTNSDENDGIMYIKYANPEEAESSQNNQIYGNRQQNRNKKVNFRVESVPAVKQFMHVEQIGSQSGDYEALSSSYGAPAASKRPSSSYGAPSASKQPSSSYGAPSNSNSYIEASVSSSYKTNSGSSSYRAPTITSSYKTQQSSYRAPASNSYRASSASSSYRAPSSSYGAPASNRPSSSYGAPASNTPSSSYGAPASNRPSSSYGATASNRPSSSYGAPASNTPSSSYGAPASNTPSSSYGAPASNTPSNIYGPPASSNKPSSSYGAPASNKPSSAYGAPTSANKPSNSYGVPSVSSAPSNTYRASVNPSTSYGAPQTPSNSYGAPQKPSASYGAPQTASNAYGPPQSNSDGWVPVSTSKASSSSIQASSSYGGSKQTSYPSSGSIHKESNKGGYGSTNSYNSGSTNSYASTSDRNRAQTLHFDNTKGGQNGVVIHAQNVIIRNALENLRIQEGSGISIDSIRQMSPELRQKLKDTLLDRYPALQAGGYDRNKVSMSLNYDFKKAEDSDSHQGWSQPQSGGYNLNQLTFSQNSQYQAPQPDLSYNAPVGQVNPQYSAPNTNTGFQTSLPDLTYDAPASQGNTQYSVPSQNTLPDLTYNAPAPSQQNNFPDLTYNSPVQNSQTNYPDLTYNAQQSVSNHNLVLGPRVPPLPDNYKQSASTQQVTNHNLVLGPRVPPLPEKQANLNIRDPRPPPVDEIKAHSTTNEIIYDGSVRNMGNQAQKLQPGVKVTLMKELLQKEIPLYLKSQANKALRDYGVDVKYSATALNGDRVTKLYREYLNSMTNPKPVASNAHEIRWPVGSSQYILSQMGLGEEHVPLVLRPGVGSLRDVSASILQPVKMPKGTMNNNWRTRPRKQRRRPKNPPPPGFKHPFEYLKNEGMAEGESSPYMVFSSGEGVRLPQGAYVRGNTPPEYGMPFGKELFYNAMNIAKKSFPRGIKDMWRNMPKMSFNFRRLGRKQKH